MNNSKKTVKQFILILFVVILCISIFVLLGSKFIKKDNYINAHVEYKDMIEEGNEFKEPSKDEQLEVLKELKPPNIIKDEDKQEIDEDSLSILFLGLDTRGRNLNGRSDAILLMTANKNTRSIKLLSIPRDSYVGISGKGFNDKINHAYSYGGVDISKETVENLLGIHIDYYVVFNFYTFIEVVDILGGVEVEVPFNFSEESTTEGKWIYFKKGKHLLNGEEALAYVRMRYQDPKGDIGRGERQQQVMESLISKSMNLENVFLVKDIYEAVSDNMKTNIGLLDMIDLLPHVNSLNNIELLNVEGRGKMIKGVYYHQLDSDSLENVIKKIRDHLEE